MKNRYVIFIIAAVSLLCNLYGIGWGLPSEERLKFAFGTKDRLNEELANASNLSQTAAEVHFTEEKTAQKNTRLFDLIRTYHSDESFFLKGIINLHPGSGDFDPDIYYYPSFHYYFTAGVLKLASVVGYVKEYHSSEEYIRNPDDMARIYLVVRLITALMATGCVILTYFIGKKLFSARAGVLGAFFLAVLPIWALHAHFGKVDIPSTFWLLLGLLFLTLFMEKKALKFLVIGAILFGASFATKYPALAGILFVPFAAYGVYGKGANRWRKIAGACALAGGIVVLVFFILSPFVIVNFNQTLKDLGEYAKINYRPVQDIFTGLTNRLTNYVRSWTALAATMGWPAFVVGVAGFFYTFSRKMSRFMLFVFVLVYFVIVGSSNLIHPNFMLMIIPAVALGVGALVDRIMRYRWAMYAGAIIFSAVILYSFLFTLGYDHYMQTKDVRNEVSQYVIQNIEKGSTIGVVQYPVIYRMPAVTIDYDYQVLDESNLTDSPRYCIIGNIARNPSSEIEAMLEEKYVVKKTFDGKVTLWGITFPSLSERVASGIGQIDPVFTLYEKR